MPAADIQTLTLLALLPLIAWRLYARIRRMLGRQRLSRVRPWITLAVFPPVLWLLAALAHLQDPQRPWWLAPGLALGGALALHGLKRTRFEATPEGLFYTPDTRLGIAISLLFVGRIGWRLVELAASGLPPPGQPDTFTTSPATLAVIGLLAGYSMVYAAGLLRWRFTARPLKAG